MRPLFPEHAPRPGRYAAKTAPKPHGRAEVELTFAVLLASATRGEWNRWCVTLCELLGRAPAYPPGAKPARERYAAACEDRVRNHVGDVLAGRHRYDFAATSWREGLPVTWGEARILQTWASLPVRLGRDQLLVILGRATAGRELEELMAVPTNPDKLPALSGASVLWLVGGGVKDVLRRFAAATNVSSRGRLVEELRLCLTVREG